VNDKGTSEAIRILAIDMRMVPIGTRLVNLEVLSATAKYIIRGGGSHIL
jgi:hypothetical protein